MPLVFPSQKGSVLVFGWGEVPSDAEGFTPTDSPANFSEDPQSYPQILLWNRYFSQSNSTFNRPISS